MRKICVDKQIHVQGVPVSITWFCPYCCSTVDTAIVILRGTRSMTRTSVRLARLLDYSRPPLVFGDMSWRNHKETCGLRGLPYKLKVEHIQIGLLTQLRGDGQRMKADERARTRVRISATDAGSCSVTA